MPEADLTVAGEGAVGSLAAFVLSLFCEGVDGVESGFGDQAGKHPGWRVAVLAVVEVAGLPFGRLCPLWESSNEGIACLSDSTSKGSKWCHDCASSSWIHPNNVVGFGSFVTGDFVLDARPNFDC